MTKVEFLDKLGKGLSGLPKEEIDNRLDFYSEIIDDKIEDGLSEEQAVEELGSVESIINGILKETPIINLVKQKIKEKRKLKTWEIVLICVGSPIWLSLLISLVSVGISIYASIWAGIISLWAVGIALFVSGFCSAVLSLISIMSLDAGVILVMLGIFNIAVGLSILLLFCCKIVTKSMISLTKNLLLMVKKAFVKGGKNNE